MKKDLNTMNTFGNGFKIERDGKIFTLTQEEMSDFRYLDKVLDGRSCLEAYTADDVEKAIIEKMMNDEDICYSIEQDVLDILLEDCGTIEQDVIQDYIKIMRTVEENKKLIQKYPFLQTKDCQGNEIFECTWLDFMPKGWKQCFGELLCEDILKVLQKSSTSLEDFTILDIKEKLGTLRVYWTGSNELECELEEIINKYEYLSKYTCVLCGKLNVPIYGGWISPYCDECACKAYPIEEAHLQNTFTKTIYRRSNATKKEVILDISDIIERIDKKFKGDFHE